MNVARISLTMFDIKKTYSYITERCRVYDGNAPLCLALELMNTEYIRMHGPEHHYLTAAVLCSAWCNAIGEEKTEHLEHLEKRCELIYPGVCGYFGVCGDVMALGAAFSEMKGVTYLSGKPWHDIADFTAKALQAVADSCKGGPRCCKRTTFAALASAVHWLREEKVIELEIPENLNCPFSAGNSQCVKKGCIY